MSKKGKGADSILYNATKGTAVTTGALTADTWYKIKSFGATSALPFSGGSQTGYIFKSPALPSDAITLASGDSVWPLTLTEICKVDMEISGEWAYSIRPTAATTRTTPVFPTASQPVRQHQYNDAL